MFKIQENADGSTSVYHKKTGQHMCTIPVKPNSSSPLRINVVEPQRSCNATVVVKDWRLSNFKTKVPDDSSTEESSDDDLKSSSCCMSSPEPSDASEAPDDPKETFMRALNLLPKGGGLPGGKTMGQWPLRRQSRVDPAWPRLITELTPLSCRIGRQLLGEDPKLKETRLIAAVRKYEGLCVASGQPPSEPSHARLRLRRTMYPVCTSSKTLRAESTHVYSYGRRQRRERLGVIETGLDKRSRQLLIQCRECEVRLERVSKEEIKRWRRRPTPQLPCFLVNSGIGMDRPQAYRRPPLRPLTVRLLDITRCIMHNGRDGHYYLVGTSIRVLDYGEFLAARPKPPLKPKNSDIPIIDLTLDSPPKSTLRTLKGPRQNCMSWQRPVHVVSNSAVSLQRPTQLHSVLKQRTTQLHGGNSIVSRQRPATQPVRSQQGPTTQLHRVSQPVSRQGPATQLHRVGQPVSRQGPATQPVLSRQGPITQLHHVSQPASRQRPPQLQVNHCVSRQRPSANSISLLRPATQPQNSLQRPTTQSHGPVLRAMLQAEDRRLPTHFRCFACGCNRYITSSNAELEVLEHMRRFHSVSQPDRFLTVYRDQVKRCTIVEAFPGYKGNND